MFGLNRPLVRFFLLVLHLTVLQAQTEVPSRPCVPDTLTEFPGSIVSSSYSQIDLAMNSGKVAKIDLPNIFGSPQQACKLPNNRMLLFGDAGGGGITTVVITDFPAARLIDTFYAYSPVLSPNRTWLAFRRFYPLTGAIDPTEQYMI